MTEAGGTYTSRQMTVAGVLVAVLLIAILLWQWTQMSQLVSKVDSTAATVASQPWAASLANASKAQGDAITQATTDIASLKTTLATATDTLGTLQSSVKATQDSVAAIEQKTTSTADATSTAVADSLKQVQADLADLKAKLASGDTAASATGERIGKLETGLAQIGTQIAAISDSLTSQTSTTSSLETQLTTALDSKGARTDLDNLQQSLGTLAAKVAALPQTDLTPLNSAIDTLNTKVASLPDDSKVAAIDTRLAAVESGQDPALRGDVDSLKSELTALSDKVTTLGSDLASRPDAAQLTALGDKVAALDSKVAALPDAQKALFEPSLAELRTRLDTLQGELANAATHDDLKALDSKIDKATLSAGAPPHVLLSLYYGKSQVQPDDAAQAQLADLATQLKAQPQAVSIVGFTDSRGPAEYNRALSLRRAVAVRRALVELGVDASLLTSVSGMGEDAPPVATADDTVEPGNRVVQIYGVR